MSETAEFSLSELTWSWRRRPILHFLVFLCALIPLGRLIQIVLGEGISVSSATLLIPPAHRPVVFGFAQAGCSGRAA